MIQVVSTNVGGSDIIADGYVGSGASITPSSASNNVLIILTGFGEQISGGASDYAQIQLHKTTTSIATVNNAFTYQYTVGTRVPFAINFLSNPSTTSSVQYRLYHDEISGGASYRYYQQNWTLIEIAG